MGKRFLLIVMLASATASADPMVVALDGDAIYVDLGARDGVGEGTTLELLHEVVAHDPRTNAVLRDRFSLGTLTIAKSGEHVSIAHAEAGLDKRVAVGDHVRSITAPRKFVDPWAEQVQASKGNPSVAVAPVAVVAGGPDHVALVGRAWEDTLGHSPEERIARWTALLAADPKTPYHRAVDQEIASLNAQLAERASVIANAKAASTTDRRPRIAQLARALANNDAPIVTAPIEHAAPGRDLVMSFLVRTPSTLRHASLYVRAPDTAGFRRIDLVPDGDANLRGTIDRAMVRAPKLEWYVESDALPLLGSQDDPQIIAIASDVTEAPIEPGRTHIDAHVDYVDFDGKLGKGFDQYYQAELDFGYRFLDPIHMVRLGFGTMSGTGGPKDIIDADKTGQCLDDTNVYRCRKMTFSYVYVELEHRVRPNVAVMLRPNAGLLTTDVSMGTASGRCQDGNIAGCSFYTGYGVRGRVRFGAETGTNLVIGAAFTSHVGTLFEAAYNWRPSPFVPVQLSVQVTDMPVPENFGVRLIADVGWRKLAWFYPSVRASYQARDIDHSGVSGGFAMNFDW